MPQAVFALPIFIITYAIIISEKIDRVASAFLGASMMVLFGVLSHTEVIDFIDFNTIGLLFGMMIMVNILKTTGVFEYIAIRAAKLAKGEPLKIMTSFCFITAILSALLDNVTTVLLIAPVTLIITDKLKLNPIPFLLPQILASNIGGTATLIGDPPNIMIGSAANFSFMDFIINVGPISAIILIVCVFIFKLKYKNKMNVSDELKEEILKFEEKECITDRKKMYISLFVLFLVLIGLLLHRQFDLESSSVALIGASIMLVLTRSNVEKTLEQVEWPTIFFFIFLFVLVGGLESSGVIDKLASIIVGTINDNLVMAMILILWSSAILSTFLDNIPFVATMIPLIAKISEISTVDITPIWWALSLGACLGGNGSLIGASANLIVAGILKKHGNEIKFIDYLKVGFPIMIMSIVIATIYLILIF